MAVSLTKQYNFKLNEDIMTQAREIVTAKGMTMTDAISLFVERIVLERDLPIKTADELYRDELIAQLQEQSNRALEQYRNNQGLSLAQMRERYDV